MRNYLLPFFAGLGFILLACKSFNLFPVDYDSSLGLQVNNEILSKPSEFPVLAERGNEEAYKYIRTITDKLLATGKVANQSKFKWEVRIIKDDKTLNAFCTPGGYIYVYTGLIKYLDSEDQLAGVMGHEIAHAALRHSTRQMSKMVGVEVLANTTQAATSGKDQTTQQATQTVANLAASLTNLRFSRDHERESDAASVDYLCAAGYNATGTAGFFRKIQNEAQPPQFLSTHPNPGNRVKDIEAKAKAIGCSEKPENTASHSRIKKLLP